MIPILVNCLLSILTLLAFVLCGFYALFRNTALMEEVESIRSSYNYVAKPKGEKFTLFMTKRKLDCWTFVATELASKSMLISLVIGIIQWGSALKAGGGFDPIREFLENPGFLFYAQFALMSYVTISMAVIDHTVRLFSKV